MFSLVNLLQDQSKISPYISSTLLREIETALKQGQKTLLYLNKRGAFSSLICEDCQHLFECENCDVSLTVHNNPHLLRCHLCQNHFPIPHSCPSCQGQKLKQIGVGTQQIESILREYFSDNTNIYRFDSDAMKTVSSKREALSDLEKADIIIGTKMITTGFDFENIACIGVILVESELSMNGFDSEANAYATLRQVIGRGNRKHQKTEIILQSFIPKNPLIQQISQGNFKDFLRHNLEERKAFGYPPFSELITLEYRHKDHTKSLDFIRKLCETLKNYDAENNYTFLPGSSSFKKNNLYHTTLLIKGANIRGLLKNIEKTILRESSLSVIFHG